MLEDNFNRLLRDFIHFRNVATGERVEVVVPAPLSADFIDSRATFISDACKSFNSLFLELQKKSIAPAKYEAETPWNVSRSSFAVYGAISYRLPHLRVTGR